MANFRDLLAQAKEQIDGEVTPEELKERIERGEKPQVLDVREQDEAQYGV